MPSFRRSFQSPLDGEKPESRLKMNSFPVVPGCRIKSGMTIDLLFLVITQCNSEKNRISES